MGKTGVRLLLGVALFVGAGEGVIPAQAGEAAAVAHPENWPAAHSPAAITDAKTEAFITGLMDRISVEEKVGQVIQGDISAMTPEDLRKYPLGSVLAGGNSGPNGNERSTAKDWADLVAAYRAVSMEKRPGHVPIPILFGVDAVHGHSNLPSATIFPHNVGLGATRDPELMERLGRVTAEELAASGIEWSFAPTLAAPQDVRWGRSYEGFSEDPEIVRSYAGAMVRGLQGELKPGRPIAADRVAGSAKHFLADGGTVEGRDQGDAQISEAELVRLHAQGYPPAIDAGVLTAMVSFSSWQGVKNHGNKTLLTDVLKGRMGFEGLLVGDWNAHGQLPGCSVTDCPAALNAGLDLYMAPDSWKGLYENTLKEVKAGTIPMSRLDDAVRRILRVKVKAGLFDGRKATANPAMIGAPEHLAVAREAVAKSLVLLKNNGHLLPLSPKANILVAGDGADNMAKQVGGWTVSWQATDVTRADFPNGQTIFEGIRDAAAAAGGTATLSADGSHDAKPDVAVVVFGENPYAEFQGDVTTLAYHPGDQKDLLLLRKLKAQGIPVVAVFLSGRPMWVNQEINASDAFVAAWLPGSQGAGIADVLLRKADGAVNRDFTGKLAFTWPKTAKAPVVDRASPAYDPQFPFGFGLTYADKGDLGALSEDPGIDVMAALNQDRYLGEGKVFDPWQLTVSDAGGERHLKAAEISSPNGGVSLRVVDLHRQEDGKAASWKGGQAASVVIKGPSADLRRQLTGGFAMAIDWRLDAAPTAPVKLSFGAAAIDVSPLLKASPSGKPVTFDLPLRCFESAGANFERVDVPFALSTEGKLDLVLGQVSLHALAGPGTCPSEMAGK